MRWAGLFALCGMVASAQQHVRPRITGIAHAGIYVHDIGAARQFYTGLLGFGEAVTLNKPDGSLQFAFVKVNERQYLELFPEVAAGSDRLVHIALETDNAEGMRAYLASHGIGVPQATGKGRVGNSNFTVKDPDGHTVEFVQYEPDSLTTRESGKLLNGDRVSKRILHLGILVGSLDAATKFYGDVLGFRETWRGSRDGKVLDWTNMRVPDGTDYVEFMLYDRLPEPSARGSAHHVALEVPDAVAAVKALETKPARKSYTRPIEVRTGVNRRRQVNLFDPDGTRIELMEPNTVDGTPAPPSSAPPPRP